MKSTVSLALAAALAISGCSRQSETSVSPEATSSAASAITQAASSPASAVQTLTSKDGKLSVQVENSSFTDVSNDTAQIPPGTSPADIVMLQRDEAQDILLYATNLGKPKKPAAEYFAKLKQNIEADKSLKDVKTGTATDNRMGYSFTQAEGDDSLSENCVSIYSPAGLYDVCANSPSATPDQLAHVLSNIKLAP